MPKAPKTVRDLLDDLILAVSGGNKKQEILMVKKIMREFESKPQIPSNQKTKKVELTKNEEVFPKPPRNPKIPPPNPNTFREEDYDVTPVFNDVDKMIEKKVPPPQQNRQSYIPVKVKCDRCGVEDEVDPGTLVYGEGGDGKEFKKWFCHKHQI